MTARRAGSVDGRASGRTAEFFDRVSPTEGAAGEGTESGLAWVCRLCPNQCRLAPGVVGRCQGRAGGEAGVELRNYGRVVAANLDPIEKKPLYHFMPGRPVFSVGTFGCNLSCRFCQNSDLSQATSAGGDVVAPAELVEIARRYRENVGVAFTYNEPGIWYEYVVDCALLLRAAGLKTILVTNGYLETAPFARLLPLVDAFNIDVKGFTEDFYQRHCGGHLAPVLANVAAAVRAGRHVEVTHLVVTDLNTHEPDFVALVDWLADLDAEVPLHLSRYFPRYRCHQPATDPALLERWAALARRRLRHVYLGNVATTDGQDTRCPECGERWVRRHGYEIERCVTAAQCRCGRALPSGLIGDAGRVDPSQGRSHE